MALSAPADLVDELASGTAGPVRLWLLLQSSVSGLPGVVIYRAIRRLQR